MKKLIKKCAIPLGAAISLAAISNANATSYQIFANLDFANPAALNSVKDEELIIGGMTMFSRFHFTGAVTPVPGGPAIPTSTTSRTTDLLPYGRFAKRLSPQWVASLDITQPYYTNIEYPRDSIANVFATETYIRDTNFSPKISYQATPRLALGFGLDANNLYNGQLNFAVPPFGVMTNKADSWAYGWDAGLFFVATPATFLNLNYYSQIVQHANGHSYWGPFNNNHLSADVKLPATLIANAIQMLSMKWALSGTVRYTQWDTLRYTVLQHTAIPAGIPPGSVPGGTTIVVPDHFFNNVSLELATHYQINDKWAGLAAFDYEPNVQPTYTRNIGLPTYTRVIPAIGGEYMLSKSLKAKLIYAHAFSKPPINMTLATGPHIQGSERLNADAIDFSINYDI